jgi:hypothetical protein
MTNPFYSNSHQTIVKLENFISKYPTIRILIEELYLTAVIEAYHWICCNDSVNGLVENEIRNKFTHHFKHHNSLITGYINNFTIVLTKENEIYTRDETQRTDIELISPGHENKFVVECKRLNSAETRYIHGTTDQEGVYKIDGMEKFIELIYSEKDDYAGMVGFIVKGNPAKIVNKLKLKIKDFCPSDELPSLLVKKCGDWELSCQSKHIRSNNKAIHFYHIFFDFVSN